MGALVLSTPREAVAPPARVGASVANIALPAMLVKEGALSNNLAVMAAYASEHGFYLAPHGKTTMAPEIFRRQLDAGAWGITVANMSQALVAYAAGAKRVLVANEVVGQVDASAVVECLANGGRELYCLVDSVAGAGLLDQALGVAGMPGRLSVLVELGVPGGRTGARDARGAVAVAEAVAATEHLRLAGVEGYEGLLAPDRSPEAIAKVNVYLEGLRGLTVRLAGKGVFPAGQPVLVSAGGSRYFDCVAAVLGRGADYGGLEVSLVVRAGCYVVHDHGTYAKASPLGEGASGPRLVGALEVWAEVLSVPEPGLAIVGLGKRDVSYDLGFPVPLMVLRRDATRPEPFANGAVTDLNDQHGYLRAEDAHQRLGVGDRVGFGVSHPCTALDKWRTLLLVDDGYKVVGEAATFFH